MYTHELSCRIKSPRRKKRLVKTDLDKQLLQFDKRRSSLWQQKMLLPLVPLDIPYQRGWKRSFVLRDDVKIGLQRAFFETLLMKINTVEYYHDESFKRKKRRKKRYGYEIKQQLLREFHPHNWQANRMNLTDEEKDCFARVETFNVKARHTDIKYVVTEPWQYVLKVTPHIVTHIKLLDVDIERELSYIDDHIANRNLGGRINRLTRGRSYSWKDLFNERKKYVNKITNTTRYAGKEAYLELDL
jgi:hypothetical protein